MDLSYWKKRWQEGNIGWHNEKVDNDLQTFVKNERPSLSSPVLIPLCGKTLDIDWLAQQSFDVVGVDVSPLALKAVVARNSGAWSTQTHPKAVVHSHRRIQLWEADFFDWAQTAQATYCWVWDRAAFVAIDPSLRTHYLQAMAQLLRPDGFMLCKTFAYAQELSTAPPYSVTEAQMLALSAPWFTAKRIQSNTSFHESGTLARRGAPQVTTDVWQLSVISEEKMG